MPDNTSLQSNKNVMLFCFLRKHCCIQQMWICALWRNPKQKWPHCTLLLALFSDLFTFNLLHTIYYLWAFVVYWVHTKLSRIDACIFGKDKLFPKELINNSDSKDWFWIYIWILIGDLFVLKWWLFLERCHL